MSFRSGYTGLLAGITGATALIGIVESGLAQSGSNKAPGRVPGSGEIAVSADASALFETKVRPLLVAKCGGCHGAESKPIRGGLRLDSRAALLTGGAHGPAVILDDPTQSLLLKSISYTDPALRMPPGGRLKDSEIALLTAWIGSGAPWPEARPAALPPASSMKSGGKAFWAFQAPKRPTPPKVKNSAWVRSPLDAFVLAGLETKGLIPAPPADRRTLLRRATFDLTGLPPTPEETAAFLADHCPDAYEKVLDRLLASPAYGERWGRHWLDVARYADSNGLDENLVFTQAWRYRDYVVRAFNRDLPIDRFIQEQIAGDLLPPAAEGGDDLDRFIATGYLSLGPKMLAEDDPVKQEMDIIDEQVDTLGKTFLGLTLGCARCHDHKFDPLPQTDYYALAGIFKSTRTMLNFKNMAEWQEIPLASKADQERLAKLEAEIGAKRTELQKQRESANRAVLAAAEPRIPKYGAVAVEWLLWRASGVKLAPVIATPNGAAPAGTKVIEAEEFARGNVLRDREGYGKGIGVLVNAGQYPNRTEYDVEVPEAGPYQIDLRYASGDPRPIRIYLNDALMTSQAAGQVTGGFYPDAQRWFAEGVFPFRAGKNTIRFERDSYFPHVDKFLILSRKGQAYPRTAEALASDAELVPELLLQAAQQIEKEGAEAKLHFELPMDSDRLYPAEVQTSVKGLTEEIGMLEQGKPVLPRAMAVSEGTPTTLKVHLRGNYLTLGRECARGFPAVLAGSAPVSIDPAHSGRLELARWLTRPDQPLTARVFVNRVWRGHFGKGIVVSTDNFGALGDRPADQPLLDWLATTFVSDGWSLKRLHKRLMLSSTYRMSSRYNARAAQIDPENRLHWRMDRRRLEAEEIRDFVLAVGGTLDRTLGGSLLTFRDREYVTSTANADPVNYRSSRRSLYLPVIRSALYDVYTAFDFGDPTVMNGDRSTTTVAPQALFLMNSPLVLEQTTALAKRVLAQPGTDEARIGALYEICFARPATPAEIRQDREALSRFDTLYAPTVPDFTARQLRSWQSLCKALLSASEFLYVE